MQISTRQLLLSYLIILFFFIIYILTAVKECEAYWIHDLSISITKLKLITDTSYLFMLPMLIILIQTFFRIKTQVILFFIHTLIAFTSFLLLLFAIDKPCENLNNEHYMFISSTMIIAYYFLKSVSFVIVGIIIIQTIFSRNKP